MSDGKRKAIPYEGRLTFCDCMISNLLIHYLPVFRIPKIVAKNLGAIQ